MHGTDKLEEKHGKFSKKADWEYPVWGVLQFYLAGVVTAL